MYIKLTDEQKRFLANETLDEIINFFSVPENQEKFNKWKDEKNSDVARTKTN